MKHIWETRFICAALIAGGLLTGCGRSPAPPAAAQQESVLFHSPPIKQLSLKQLKALSIECEKYLAGSYARGPYDAKYCQDATDAWGDAPLELVRIPK